MSIRIEEAAILSIGDRSNFTQGELINAIYSQGSKRERLDLDYEMIFKDMLNSGRIVEMPPGKAQFDENVGYVSRYKLSNLGKLWMAEVRAKLSSAYPVPNNQFATQVPDAAKASAKVINKSRTGAMPR